MYHVMMVCTGNICRSPMAAGLLAHYLPVDFKERVKVTSSGTHALHGHQAQENAVEAMAQLGIDINHHRARQITRENARSADLILTMEANHLSEISGLLKRRHAKPMLLTEFDPQSDSADIRDPYGEPLASYQNCIQILRPCIKGVILWLGNNI